MNFFNTREKEQESMIKCKQKCKEKNAINMKKKSQKNLITRLRRGRINKRDIRPIEEELKKYYIY